MSCAVILLYTYTLFMVWFHTMSSSQYLWTCYVECHESMPIYVTGFLLPRHAKIRNHLTGAVCIDNTFVRARACIKRLLWCPHHHRSLCFSHHIRLHWLHKDTEYLCVCGHCWSTYIHTYIHTYIYIYIHAPAHTHTHVVTFYRMLLYL